MVESEEGDEGLDRPLHDLVSYRLARVQAKLNAQATRILKENGGLTLVQWRVLLMLRRLGESSVGELARETQFDKALISRTVQSLVARGLVAHRDNEHDQRQQLLSTTAEGTAIFETAAPHMEARQKALRGAMSEEERSLLFDALDRLEAAADSRDPG
ncbi:MAG: MarR family winged helix-turn-helix transcriptional regulator [Silicimonas sp.]|nr:MarR family winged helix-turn-helix transcriptional regulator [Silicimonas sp.]